MSKIANQMKCDQCGRSALAEDTYVFEGETYCCDCVVVLLYDLCDYGLIYLEFSGSADKCIRVHG